MFSIGLEDLILPLVNNGAPQDFVHQNSFLKSQSIVKKSIFGRWPVSYINFAQANDCSAVISLLLDMATLNPNFIFQKYASQRLVKHESWPAYRKWWRRKTLDYAVCLVIEIFIQVIQHNIEPTCIHWRSTPMWKYVAIILQVAMERY
jgi:hypothetical protein